MEAGGGFRLCYQQALRVEENIDWTVHALDYGLFKERLLFFRHRRRRLKAYLRSSPSETISESILTSIIGPNIPNTPLRQSLRNEEAGYDQYYELSASSSASMDLVPTHITTGTSFFFAEKSYKKRAVLRRVYNTERDEVTLFLTNEMDKVAMFYMAQWQYLSSILVEQGPSPRLGREILELYAHCIANLVALRQSLIRYDAFVRTYGGTPMLVWFMKKMRKHQNSFRKILFHEELKALMDTFCSEARFNLISFRLSWDVIERVELETQKAEYLASRGQVALLDSFVHTVRHYLLLGAIEDRMLSLEPTFLTQRGASLTKEIQELAGWRQVKEESSPSEPPSTQKLSAYEYFALGLNILGSFLYCMNYYIVEPSSTKYVNALGAPDYVSATLIGMMPLAAMSSAVGYAVWTNHGFRPPLIASSSLLVVGNLIYSSALKFGAVWVALVGRFMTGLGAPKCIIRRYMADTTPVAMRTSVNAAFALTVAVGSALGPAMAILLNQFDTFVQLPLLGVFAVNGMTGPGLFMAATWSLYLMVVVMTFEEPGRLGLEEQRRIELALSTVSTLESRPPSPSREAQFRTRGSNDDLNTIFSGEDRDPSSWTDRSGMMEIENPWWKKCRAFFDLVTPPVRLCLGLLFAKTFTIESLVSCTSALSKNRYGWDIKHVGVLGCINGLLVVPLSITVGYLSMYYQDRLLMTWLVAVGCLGMFLLIDVTDLVATPTSTYNEDTRLSVDPTRYVSGYFLSYISIQSFEGVVGSALSKVIPTALASGTFNSGLLATLVDTLGRASGDLFISFMGWVNMRQLMNLLFIPAFGILVSCLIAIRRFYDLLAV